MKNRLLFSILAMLLMVGTVWAAEVTDLNTTDASNTDSSYGFPENMAPSAVNDNSRAFQGIIARWYEDWRGALVANAGGNAIHVSPNRTISAYEDGLYFAFEATGANTGAATVNFGAGSKTIKKQHDQDLASGDIEAGQKIIVVYNADEDVFQLLTPVANSAAGFTDPMTTRGDLIYRNSSNTTARLAIGTTNQLLHSDGADLTWGFDVLDEDTLVSNSATATATQQSIKAYVDTTETGKIVSHVYAETSAQSSGTTQIPFDNTIPQNTEGDEYLSVTITPSSTDNYLIIRGVLTGNVFSSSSGQLSYALFRNGVSNALAAWSEYADGPNANSAIHAMPFFYRMQAPSTSGIEFTVRAGSNLGSTTMYVNGNSSGRIFGAIAKSHIEVIEVAP